MKGVLPMENIKQHDHRTTRRPDCVTEIRMGNTVLVVSGFFKKDTTSTAADKMARSAANFFILHSLFFIKLVSPSDISNSARACPACASGD